MKTRFFTVKRIIALITSLLLLIVNFILGLVSKSLISGLYEQLGAQRWSEDTRMAQVSLFTTEDQMIREDDLRRFEYMLEKNLRDSGIDDPDDEVDKPKKIVDTIPIDDLKKDDSQDIYTVPERTGIRRLFAYSYCAQGQVSLTFENRTADKVAAVGAGGDFFLFHPLIFLSGGPFSGDDIMKDGIVIDEDLAWQLFGSYDIVGQSVTIRGVPHYIEGVVKKDKGRIHKASGLDKSYVYMSYDSLSRYGTILSGRFDVGEVSEDGTTAQKGGINCIEVVCPNPVKGLAARISKESLGVQDEFVSVIDNTDRFSFFSLLKVLGSFGTRSMWNKAIYYPYWENLARGYEDILAMILLFRIICVIAAIVILTVFIVNAYLNKTWTAGSLVRSLLDKKYDLEAEHKRKKEQDSLHE